MVVWFYRKLKINTKLNVRGFHCHLIWIDNTAKLTQANMHIILCIVSLHYNNRQMINVTKSTPESETHTTHDKHHGCWQSCVISSKLQATNVNMSDCPS